MTERTPKAFGSFPPIPFILSKKTNHQQRAFSVFFHMSESSSQKSHGPALVYVLGALILIMQLWQAGSGFISHATGADTQRQIEPTQIAALQNKLDSVTNALSNASRELGELKTSVNNLTVKITSLEATQKEETRSISDVRARVNILEKQRQ